MILIDFDCDKCKNEHKELKDGWIPTCKAFPEGIPDEYWLGNPAKLPECNNGIKFETKEKNNREQ